MRTVPQCAPTNPRRGFQRSVGFVHSRLNTCVGAMEGAGVVALGLVPPGAWSCAVILPHPSKMFVSGPTWGLVCVEILFICTGARVESQKVLHQGSLV